MPKVQKSLTPKAQEVLDYLLAKTELYGEELVGKFVECDPSHVDLTRDEFDSYIIVFNLRGYIHVGEQQGWETKEYRKGDGNNPDIWFMITAPWWCFSSHVPQRKTLDAAVQRFQYHLPSWTGG
tara:strand:+ start:449 stop:820 length:372 start_codon:yes stop_codon:yes gene_type:complete